MEQKLEQLAAKYRVKPIRIAYYVLENDEHRLYISYKDATEASIKFKTREGATAFIPRLYKVPLPCRICGTTPIKTGDMVSCTRCSIHAGTEARWNELMTDALPIRKLLADTGAAIAVCRDVVMLSEEQFLVQKAMRVLDTAGKLDLSAHFTDAEDARIEEERLKRGG